MCCYLFRFLTFLFFAFCSSVRMILLALYFLLCLARFLLAIFSSSPVLPRRFSSASRCSVVFLTNLFPWPADSNSTTLAAFGYAFCGVFNAGLSHHIISSFQAFHNQPSKSTFLAFCFWPPFKAELPLCSHCSFFSESLKCVNNSRWSVKIWAQQCLATVLLVSQLMRMAM